jgi:hypothetical protein
VYGKYGGILPVGGPNLTGRRQKQLEQKFFAPLFFKKAGAFGSRADG